jgi:ubiquinone/menaquinone biosynthesis C-methylase UbiE
MKDDNYVCPDCKRPLTPTANGLCCQREGVEYPIKNGIVDFVTEGLTKSTNLFFRFSDKLDDFAKIYEGPSWYGTLDKVNAEFGLPSLEEMAKMLTEVVDAKDGLGLDVACGTGFFTRPLAQKMRLVYGIDISMGMLEQATEYAQEKGIGNIRFARSRAERLPFPDSLFDGVTCSGALHTFQDTVEALKEMARVMKSGAPLAVLTILKQDLSILKRFYERVPSNLFGEEASLEVLHLFDVEEPGSYKQDAVLNAMEQKMLHFFDVEELDKYLAQTGFIGFKYDVYGPTILFHAKKGKET